MDHRGWYEEIYPRLTGGGLWLCGGELNTLPVEEHGRRLLRVLFARLSTYFDTAASFTHQLLYQLAATTPDVFADLAYLPPRRDLELFRAGDVPWLLGTTTKLGPEAFDLVGLSLSIVQELLNLPALLRKSGLPLGKRARLERADLPLLILGGASALYATALWEPDPLVDAIFVGESDHAIRQILEICREAKRQHRRKREILDELGAVEGVLEPDHPRRARKARRLDLDGAEQLCAAPVLHLPEVLGSAHLQIDEGCPCFCSFCAESWDRKPYRQRGVDVLRAAALRAKAAMGLEAIEIHSASFNAHSGIYELLWELAPRFARLGLKSQRLDALAHDPAALELQQAVGKTSLTVGLEGISPRLRRYLHKSLDDDEVVRGLATIARAGGRELKVFLIVTGLEQDEDLSALAALLGQLRGAVGGRARAPRTIFSGTSLVRFPWTPLEFEDAPPAARCRPILRRVARAVHDAGFEHREAASLPEYWVSQVLVRAADPRVGAALRLALEDTGFLYYREVSSELQRALGARLAAAGLDEARLLAGHTLEERAGKPWALVDTGVDPRFLWDEALRARAAVDEGYCLGRSWAHARCSQCGACPTPEHVAALVGARQTRPYRVSELRERLGAARAAEATLELLVEVGPAARGLPRRAFAVALARALMGALPELVHGYRRTGAARCGAEDQPAWLEGEELLTLHVDRAALDTVARAAADPEARASVDRLLGTWGRWRGLAPAGWRPARLELTSPFRLAPDAYLRERGLKGTRRRLAEADSYRLELSRDSLRKGVLVVLAWRALPRGGCLIEVVPGPKLDAEELLRRAFQLPHPEEWRRVRAVVRGPAR